MSPCSLGSHDVSEFTFAAVCSLHSFSNDQALTVLSEQAGGFSCELFARQMSTCHGGGSEQLKPFPNIPVGSAWSLAT